MRVDLHQHIWTEPLIEALSRRDQLPLIRRHDGLTVLHSHGEQPWPIDRESESGPNRAALLRNDFVDLAVIAVSSPTGIESLPRRQALALIDAHLTGVAALGEGFASWGALAMADPDPEDVDALAARGCVGVSIPAGALAGPDRFRLLAPILERIQALELPLLVHPGRAPGQVAESADLGEPPWWRAMTDYVTQMQLAWLTFAAFGRREFPALRIVFVALAGGAPLSAERLLTRSGPKIDLRDPNTFYETSSYGPDAISAISLLVGEEQLVYGSDRTVIEPMPTTRDEHYQRNAAALLDISGDVHRARPNGSTGMLR